MTYKLPLISTEQSAYAESLKHMLEDRLMSNEYRHVELLTGDVRCGRWTTEQKLTIIEQSVEPGEMVSSTGFPGGPEKTSETQHR